MSLMINTFYDNDDYLFQHITDNNDKVLVYCLSPRCDVDPVYTLELDIYGKIVLLSGYDLIFIRSKTQRHMNDADCDLAMANVISIANQYNTIDGLFECGGSVLGLYFSKHINYRNIYLDSARFLDGMTIEETDYFKFTKYKIIKEVLNFNCKYFSFYNHINLYDHDHTKWLITQGINIEVISYLTATDNMLHPIKNVIGLRKYFKTFLPNILRENYNHDEIFN